MRSWQIVLMLQYTLEVMSTTFLVLFISYRVMIIPCGVVVLWCGSVRDVIFIMLISRDDRLIYWDGLDCGVCSSIHLFGLCWPSHGRQAVAEGAAMGILPVRKEQRLLRCTFLASQGSHWASHMESSQTYSDGELYWDTGFSGFSRTDFSRGILSCPHFWGSIGGGRRWLFRYL